MMEQVSITAQNRNERGTGPARELRRKGYVPGVIYGAGVETRQIAVSTTDLQQLLRQGINSLVKLEMEGLEQRADMAALLQDLQRHPITREVQSVDFKWISLKEAVHVNVTLELVGTSPGVEEGGALDQIMFDVPVSCLPIAIPESVKIDISSLEIGQTLHAGLIELPEGVELLIEPDDAVVSVSRPISDEDLEVRTDEELGEELEELADEEAAETAGEEAAETTEETESE